MTCPMGKQSISWLPNTYKNGMTWEVRFARKGLHAVSPPSCATRNGRSHASWDSGARAV